jgi:hypothetical protein
MGEKFVVDKMKSERRFSSRARAAEAFNEAASTVTIATRPSPTISADAVEAVRRGLRFAFSVPSLPTTPRNARPNTADSGRDTNGDRLATPTKVSAAPPPTIASSFGTSTNRPRPSKVAPPAATTDPKITRRVRAAGGATPSRSASTGATRDARRAGAREATTVTTVPTASEATTVRTAITDAVPASSSPNASNSRRSVWASRIPAPRPSAEATTPTAIASVTIEPSTCRRLAPSDRSRPISRVRWVTRMLNVLKMMKAPTNTETNANTSSVVRRNPSASSTCSACCFAASVPVTASYPSGRSWAIARRRS